MIRRWYAYNARARRGYVESFARLPREELTRDRGASYPTLLNILEHTLGAYCYWFGNMSKSITKLPRFVIQDDKEEHTLEELDALERQVQSQVDSIVASLTEHELDLTFRMPRREHPVSVRDALWHLVEEELQHRGELNALLWQIDVDPPIFDWIKWVDSLSRPQGSGEVRLS